MPAPGLSRALDAPQNCPSSHTCTCRTCRPAAGGPVAARAGRGAAGQLLPPAHRSHGDTLDIFRICSSASEAGPESEDDENEVILNDLEDHLR